MAFAATMPSEFAERRGWLKAEEIALLVLFATLTFDNLNLLGVGQTGVGVSEITLAKLATLAALGIWTLRALLTKDPRLLGAATGNLSTYFIYAFLLVSCLSIAAHSNIDPAKYPSNPWAIVIRRVQLVIVFYLILAIARRRQMFHYALAAYLLGGLLTCYAGCYELATGRQFLEVTPWQNTELLQGVGTVVRSQGLHEDADHQVTFLMLGLAFVPYLWHCAKRWHWRAGLVLIAALYVVAAFGTGAKGGWIGMAMVFGFFLIALPGRKKWAAAAAVLVAGAATFVALGYSSTVVTTEKFSTKYAFANTTRFGLIKMAWETVKDHPVFGAGTGSSFFLYHRYFPAAGSAVPNKPYPQTNDYMRVWAENGTVGLAVFLLMLGAVLLELGAAVRNAPDVDARMLGLGLLAAYLAMLWAMNIYAQLDSKYLWMTIGMAVAYANLYTPTKEATCLGREAASSPPVASLT